MRNEAPRPVHMNDERMAAWGGGAALVIGAVLCATAEVGGWLSGKGWVANPLPRAVALALGSEQGWSGGDKVAGATFGAVVIGCVVYWVIWYRRRARSRQHIDRKAALMGDPAPLSKAAAVAAAYAGRLTDGSVPPGLMYGTSVRGGQELWTNWRGTQIILAGPERGKTMAWAVPYAIEAPGIFVGLTNKRDYPDAIRSTCEGRGTFWVFDVQRIANYHAGRAPTWWWNPLRRVYGPADADILADILVAASTPPDTQKHPFFDTRGPALLSALILAAAVSGEQLPKVFQWIATPADRTPIGRLQSTGHAHTGAFLKSIYDGEPREKGGLFSTASNAVRFMIDADVMAWISDDGSLDPATGQPRPEFDPEEFVRAYTRHPDGRVSRDSLMIMSKEGPGTAAPLTAALTAMVTRAAELYATECPHGRLPVPMVIGGDEIGNVWRWKEVPAKATYYGSAGIMLVAIFQNWSQAVEAYGANGAKKLFEASTTRLIGGGLADRAFLADVAQLIGQYHVTQRSAQYGRGGTMTLSSGTELIMDVDELYAMGSKGTGDRFVVLPAGGYAVLAQPVRWTERPYAAEIQASITRYEPKGINP
jgi:hypothetical protein